MYEAYTALIGNVVTHPVRRSLPSGEQLVTFRMASTARRLDQGRGEWVDNGTVYVTINCWRRLVEGVDASLRLGDPIIVYGQLRSAEYRTKDGFSRHDLELRASALGPDLGRCTATVQRRGAVRNSPPPVSVTPAAVPDAAVPDAAAPVAQAPDTPTTTLDGDASRHG